MTVCPPVALSDPNVRATASGMSTTPKYRASINPATSTQAATASQLRSLLRRGPGPRATSIAEATIAGSVKMSSPHTLPVTASHTPTVAGYTMAKIVVAPERTGPGANTSATTPAVAPRTIEITGTKSANRVPSVAIHMGTPTRGLRQAPPAAHVRPLSAAWKRVSDAASDRSSARTPPMD